MSDENLQVLAVDDDTSFLEQEEIFLKKENKNFEIDTATEVDEAENLLEKREYDAIVSDYQMPEKDGLEFLEEVRKERNSDIPFIMLTGRGREEVAMEALNLGADRYLQKGGDPKEQYGILGHALENEIEKRKEAKRAEKQGEVIEKIMESAGRADVGVYRRDPSGELHHINDKFAEIHGYPKNELVGMDSREVLTKESLEKINDIDVKDFSGAETIEIETKDGETKKVKNTAFPVLDENNEIEEVWGIVQNITPEIEMKEKLREEKARYKTLVEGSHDAIFIYKGDEFEFFNERVSDITGYNEEELKNMDLWELIHEDDREKVKRIGRKRQEGGNVPEIYEAKVKTKTGDKRYVEFSIDMTTYQGEEAAIGQARDITRWKETKKALEEREEKYRTLIETSLAGIVSTDLDDNLVFLNDRLAEMLGYEKEEIKDLGLEEIIPEEEYEKIKEKTDSRKEGETEVYDSKFLAKDGDTIDVLVSASPYKNSDGQVTGTIGVIQDISEKKEAKKKVEYLHSFLRHDVKNKIQLAENYLYLLNDEEDLSEDGSDYLEKTEDILKNCKDMIEKTDDIEEIEKEEVHEIDISSTVEDVINKNEITSADKDIYVEKDGEEYRASGGRLFNKALYNVVENATKYGGDEIKISLEDYGDKIGITVEDDGDGITDDEKESIIERGRGEGSGLGMYLVDKAMKQYDGELKIDDSEMGGAKFELILEKKS